MMKAGRVAIVVSCVFVFAGGASAQFMRSGPPTMHGVWHPAVGAGAAYDVKSEKGKNSNIEMAVVGKATIDGQEGYWLEMTITSAESGGNIVMKMFTVTDGSNNRAVRTIMQMPGRPPMDMTQMIASHSGGNSSSANQPADIRNQAEDVGSESITTPAGTFTCEHYRAKDGSGDTWVSDRVSPWGMVKYQGKDSSMVVTKLITDAKDKITGTPAPFNPMQMGNQGQRPQ
jgi:hypothetical protein